MKCKSEKKSPLFAKFSTWSWCLHLSTLYYACRSSETTQACKHGRSTTIRLRCDPTVTAKDHITLPRCLTSWLSCTSDLWSHPDRVWFGSCVGTASLSPNWPLSVWTLDKVTPWGYFMELQLLWTSWQSGSLSLVLFSFTVTAQRGHVMDALSTSCGEAGTRVRSAQNTTTERLSAHAFREYR